MIPRPVEAENTAPGLLDDGGPLIDRLASEGLTIRQASLVIRFVVAARGGVSPPTCWARPQRVLSRVGSLRSAVGRFARALGNFVAHLPAAGTQILGIWLFRGSLNGAEQFLLLLLRLSFSSHEGSDNFELRLPLEPEP